MRAGASTGTPEPRDTADSGQPSPQPAKALSPALARALAKKQKAAGTAASGPSPVGGSAGALLCCNMLYSLASTVRWLCMQVMHCVGHAARHCIAVERFMIDVTPVGDQVTTGQKHCCPI